MSFFVNTVRVCTVTHKKCTVWLQDSHEMVLEAHYSPPALHKNNSWISSNCHCFWNHHLRCRYRNPSNQSCLSVSKAPFSSNVQCTQPHQGQHRRTSILLLFSVWLVCPSCSHTADRVQIIKVLSDRKSMLGTRHTTTWPKLQPFSLVSEANRNHSQM